MKARYNRRDICAHGARDPDRAADDDGTAGDRAALVCDHRTGDGAGLGGDALKPGLRQRGAGHMHAQQQQHRQAKHPQPSLPLPGDDLPFAERRRQHQFKQPASPRLHEKPARLRGDPEVKNQDEEAPNIIPDDPGLLRQCADQHRHEPARQKERDGPQTLRLPAFAAGQPGHRLQPDQLPAQAQPPSRAAVLPGIDPAQAAKRAGPLSLLPGVRHQRARQRQHCPAQEMGRGQRAPIRSADQSASGRQHIARTRQAATRLEAALLYPGNNQIRRRPAQRQQ